jgi:hypothetical protein
MRRAICAFLAGAMSLAAGCRETAPLAAKPLTSPFQTRRWDSGSPSGTELISPHYRIFTTSSSPEILNHLPGFMEAAYDNYLDITRLPDRPAKEPMTIYMMATRQEWSVLTRSLVGSQWDLYSSIEAGGYCYRGTCVFWDMGGVAALSVASHEGLHQFIHHRFRDRLPMWLEEGLATLAEGYQLHGPSVRFTPQRNPVRFTDLRRALIHDWWIPLEKLLPMDAGDAMQLRFAERVVGYYGQVWALAQFLQSDPQLAPRRARMLADAEAGRLREALRLTPAAFARLRRQGREYNRAVSLPLFRHYFTDDLPGFEKRYRDFARKLARLQ